MHDCFVFIVFFQLKIDEFESNVNEVKDPFPPDDFPGNKRDFYFTFQLICPIIIIMLALHQLSWICYIMLQYKNSDTSLLLDSDGYMSQMYSTAKCSTTW